MPLSVCIITYNCADILPGCLESVRFADEVVVIDSGSTDGTVEVAQAAGAKVAKDIAEHTQAAAAAQKAVDEAAEKLEVEKRQAAERQRQLERKQVRT